MSFQIKYFKADPSCLHYRIEHCGMPQVNGRIGSTFHNYEFLFALSVDRFIEVCAIIGEIEKKYNEQGLALLAIACGYESKVEAGERARI